MGAPRGAKEQGEHKNMENRLFNNFGFLSTDHESSSEDREEAAEIEESEDVKDAD